MDSAPSRLPGWGTTLAHLSGHFGGLPPGGTRTTVSASRMTRIARSVSEQQRLDRRGRRVGTLTDLGRAQAADGMGDDRVRIAGHAGELGDADSRRHEWCGDD